MLAPERVLIINPFGIGDVIFTTPLIRAMRRAFPQSRLTFLCNRRTEGILSHDVHLDELIVYEKDELVSAWRRSWREGAVSLWTILQQIRRGRFDFAPGVFGGCQPRCVPL